MEENKRKKIFTRRNVLLAIILLILFFLGMRLPLDPDLGWHLRSGEYIWQNKALSELDPFSHTFSEYPWIAHEWLSDLLLYGLNSFGPVAGKVAMSVVFSIIAAAAFILTGKSFKARAEYQLLAALLAMLVSVPIIGIRPQVISMLGLGLTFFIIYRFKGDQDSKAIYFLPLVFMLWVNFHGGFSFGLFAIALFFIVELFRVVIKNLYQKIRKKELPLEILQKASFIKIIIVGLLSGAATLINPYGLRLYDEIYNTFINTTGSTYIRENIAEWNPVKLGSDTSTQLVVYLILFGILLLFSIKKINLTYLITTVVFFIIGISSWRHMPLLMLAITPFWVLITKSLTGDTLSRLLKKKLMLFLFIIAMVLIARQQITGMIAYGLKPETIANKMLAPYKAVQWLKENPLKGEMLNEYNYGGFLVWNYPEKKVFIDGRMAIWELDGKNVYQDWVSIGEIREGYLDLLDKYNVDWVVMRKGLSITHDLSLNKDWEVVYDDDLNLIIVRKGSQDES